MLLAMAGGAKAQNNVVFQSTGGNTNTTAADDKQYYINGISTKEDVGGVEMSRGKYYGNHQYHLEFTNYNNFMVSVIYELEDGGRGQVTGNIILKAGETKESTDLYIQPINFKVIARQMNTGYQPQAAMPQATPAVGASAGSWRIGIVCMSELIPLLPEYASIQAKYNQFVQSKQESFDNLVIELNSKFEAYQKGEIGWSETEKQQKQQELTDLQTKLNNLKESSQQEINQYQMNQMAPLLSRMTNVIDAVGRANGYDVIIDISSYGNVMYKGKAFYELDDLVRKELGIVR